jgi:predicted NAD-dependent protein-ADP-ribosyltransferase YbiA (DUF1768 family)
MVVSRIDKKVNYIENKKLESKDISKKKRNLYELQIGNEDLLQKKVVMSIGKIQSIDGKEIYYFPIYLITKTKKAIQIGVYEIMSKDKSLIYNEDTDEVENTNLLNPPLFYSWVDNKFIEKNALLPSVIDEEERKQTEKVSKKVVIEEPQEEELIVEENIPQYRADIFEKQLGPIPSLLREETKEDADRYRKQNNINEISQFMENENYNIVNIPAMKSSDSLLYSVVTAFNTINQTTNEKKLKKKLSESKYIMKYLTSQKEKYDEMSQVITQISTEKKTLTARHVEIKTEYDKIYKDTDRKREAIKLGEENKIIVKTIKDLKEQEKKLKELIKPLEYIKTITTEEKMREYIKSNNFVSNEYILSILEKILNIKFIVFLSDAIKENDTNSIIDCGLLDETVTNFKPEFYIMLEYSKQINKYELVAYKNKVIFKFKEIPYDLKSMIITKCAEETGSTFIAIPDFKSYQLVGGRSSSIIYDDDDRKYDGVIIIIYCPSSKNKFPGEIKGEKMSTENIKKYIQLSNYENWRCILDNNWSGYNDNTIEYQFILDGYYWNSVQHYMQGCKFKNSNPSYYEKFSLGNTKEKPIINNISKNVELAIFLGKKKGGIEFKGTSDGEFKGIKRESTIDIDDDYDNSKSYYLKKALTAKFQQNDLFKKILLSTHESKLKYKQNRSSPILATELMNVRDEIR